MPAVIPTEGLNRVAQLIINDATVKIAVGTDNTAPTSADSQLGTETFRMTATTSRDGNIITIQAVVLNANLPATMEEAGVFINGGAGANSGELLVRVLVHFVKGASNDLTLLFELTLAEG